MEMGALPYFKIISDAVQIEWRLKKSQYQGRLAGEVDAWFFVVYFAIGLNLAG
jgi:hypothetical protein